MIRVQTVTARPSTLLAALVKLPMVPDSELDRVLHRLVPQVKKLTPRDVVTSYCLLLEAAAKRLEPEQADMLFLFEILRWRALDLDAAHTELGQMSVQDQLLTMVGIDIAQPLFLPQLRRLLQPQPKRR